MVSICKPSDSGSGVLKVLNSSDALTDRIPKSTKFGASVTTTLLNNSI